MIDSRGSFILAPKDRELIEELGLNKCGSVRSMEKKMAQLNMRQLDRLKLMFQRISKQESRFSELTEIGIRNNDLRSFSEALILLMKMA